MKKTKFEYSTNLGIVQYAMLVDQLTSEYFDDNGEYTPHFGIFNAMRLFYNNCVTNSQLEDLVGLDITEIADLEHLAVNKDFIEAFNAAIMGDGTIRLDFANAYRNALEIVEQKKSSFGNIENAIKKIIGNISEALSSILSTHNTAALSDIAQSMEKGKITAEDIVKAYAKQMRNAK